MTTKTWYRVYITDHDGKGGSSTPVDADNEADALLIVCRKRYGQDVTVAACETTSVPRFGVWGNSEHDRQYQVRWDGGEMTFQARVEEECP